MPHMMKAPAQTDRRYRGDPRRSSYLPPAEEESEWEYPAFEAADEALNVYAEAPINVFDNAPIKEYVLADAPDQDDDQHEEFEDDDTEAVIFNSHSADRSF